MPYISHLIDVSGLVWEDGGTRGLTGAVKEPWLVRKTRYMAALDHKSEGSLRVTAADKAHNARDMVLDARRDAHCWEHFNAGLDGTAWYLLRIHQNLSHRLPCSPSNEALGDRERIYLP